MPSDRYRRCRAPGCNEYHWTSAWPANHVEPGPPLRLLSAPMVIRDGLDDLFHPCDSKVYDSKRAFRSTTRAFGGEEVGNEENKDTRWVDDVKPDEIAVAKQMVDQGYVPRPANATAEDHSAVIA